MARCCHWCYSECPLLKLLIRALRDYDVKLMTTILVTAQGTSDLSLLIF